MDTTSGILNNMAQHQSIKNQRMQDSWTQPLVAESKSRKNNLSLPQFLEVKRMQDNWTQPPFIQVKRMRDIWTHTPCTKVKRMLDTWTQPLFIEVKRIVADKESVNCLGLGCCAVALVGACVRGAGVPRQA
jgi:hypothetical protein